MYRLGRMHCTWNLGTICPRTETEHGETCWSQPTELLSIAVAVLYTCARVHVCGLVCVAETFGASQDFLTGVLVKF